MLKRVHWAFHLYVLPVPPQVMQFTEYSFNRLAKLVQGVNLGVRVCISLCVSPVWMAMGNGFSELSSSICRMMRLGSGICVIIFKVFLMV